MLSYMITLYVICCETTCVIFFFVLVCCLPTQDRMTRNSGKSKTRGERLAASMPSLMIIGTQGSNEQESKETHVEEAISPLRNKASKWKANPVTKDPSPVIRSASAGSIHKKPSPGSSSSHPFALTKSSSTGSTPKQLTPFSGGSTSNRQHVIGTASATKDIDRKDHQQSTKKKKKDPPRSPTNSDVDTPEDEENESEDYGNGHPEQKRSYAGGRHGKEAISESSRNKQYMKKSSLVGEEARTSHKKREKQKGDSDSDDA
jgi:hypothetical protein